LLVITPEPTIPRHIAAAGRPTWRPRDKIERPKGDFARGYDRVTYGASSYFVCTNRAKTSIALHLKIQTERNRFLRMIANSQMSVARSCLKPIFRAMPERPATTPEWPTVAD
jgi:hypothetical protein